MDMPKDPVNTEDAFDMWRVGIDSYNRMAAALRTFKDFPYRRTECFRALGDAWTSSDNISEFRAELQSLLRAASRDELDAMMEPDELVAFRALPNVLTVYRGCYQNNIRGLSWSLDETVAARFPLLSRYRQHGTPILVRTRVRKARAILKVGRDESEIVVPWSGRNYQLAFFNERIAA